MTFRAGLGGALFMVWMCYDSYTHNSFLNVTRQTPAAAMVYSVGFTGGSFLMHRSGVTGAIGGFKLGPAGWSFDFSRRSNNAPDRFLGIWPEINLRHPLNIGYPVPSGAINQYSDVNLPVWMLLVAYLAGWCAMLRWREKRLRSWIRLQMTGQGPEESPDGLA